VSQLSIYVHRLKICYTNVLQGLQQLCAAGTAILMYCRDYSSCVLQGLLY